MRKITIEMVPDQRLGEIMRPLMEHMEEMEMVELLRLDLQQGLKIVVLKIRLAPGSTVEDIKSTDLFDIKIVEVMEQKGNEVTCLMKVRMPEGFDDIRKDADLDLTWTHPMKISRDKIVYSFIGEDEPIRKALELLKEFGLNAKISIHNTSFTDGDHLSLLTEKQRSILVTAKKMGYYRYPREAGAEDVAKALGLSTSTVTEHLRKAEVRLIDGILAGY
ncbi:MAG: hypothetical protein GXX95_08595 [Methanomassiliicoccus sp.]|jgi:predicted DNA binding protein|nr:hypothetical protein [Methanomassiliicoccus sp.]